MTQLNLHRKVEFYLALYSATALIQNSYLRRRAVYLQEGCELVYLQTSFSFFCCFNFLRFLHLMMNEPFIAKSLLLLADLPGAN